MADDQFEKTESASPKRREEFKKRGQVARSRELSGLAILVLTLIYLSFSGPELLELSRQLYTQYFSFGSQQAFEISTVQGLAIDGALYMARYLGLYLLLLLGTVVLVNIAQTGFFITAHPLLPDLERVNPVKRFTEMFFSTRLWTETALNLGKIVILGVVVWLVIDKHLPYLASLALMTPFQSTIYILNVVLEILLKCCIFFALIAVADYLKQWWELEKQMRMTKQEVREEFKESEGNPQVKGAIRSRMRDISFNKMIQTVPTADVVVTNPTHFAVALRYEKGRDHAPKVVAKGAGFWAERIKAIARENGVPVVENKPLARTLFKSVKTGREIPAELYRAVAELLAYVYAMKQKAGRA